MLNATNTAHCPRTATLSCATECSPPSATLPQSIQSFHSCRCRPFIRTYCNCNFNLASLLLSAALDQKPFYFVVKCTMCIFDLKLDSTRPSPSPSPAAHAQPSAINNCAAVSYEKKAKVFDSFLAVHILPPCTCTAPPATLVIYV